MKKIALFFLISLLFAINGFCQTASQYIHKRNVKLDLNDFEGAISDYTKAIKITPSSVIAYYDRD